MALPAKTNQIVVIAGPAGSGKNTILHKIFSQCGNCSRLVTATTRAPRPGEEDRRDYYFFTLEKFEAELAAGNILEHRDVPSLGTHYGIYKPDLEERLRLGGIVFAHLDIIGAVFLRDHYDAITIFIMPSSIDELSQRVRRRQPEISDAELKERMQIAAIEMEDHAPQYDYRVVNADGKVDVAVEEIMGILEKEGYNFIRHD